MEFVETCYQNEQSIMQNEIAVPTFIAKRYDHTRITPDDTTGTYLIHTCMLQLKQLSRE